MARFSDLPQELVHEILSQAQPDDIERLALTSKHIYRASGTVLEEHRKLKRRYNVISHVARVNQGEESILSTPHYLLGLLKEVLKRPRIGLYVKKLIVKGIEKEWTTDEDDKQPNSPNGIPLNPQFSDDEMELLKKIALAIPMLSPPDTLVPGVSSWLEDFKTGNHAAILGLLMVHCPNLNTFDLEGRGGHTRRIFDLFEDIAEDETDCKLLTKLKHVRFDHSAWLERKCHEDINRVKAILAVPSIESIEAVGLDGIQHREIGSPMPYRSSNIQSLYFKDCEISAKSLCEMLEATKQLKSLSLQDMNIDTYWVRVALLASAKDSLEYLFIRCRWKYGGHFSKYVGPLKAFTALKEIRLDEDVLASPKYDVVQDLEKHLPSSLESLTIYPVGGYIGHFSDEIKNLLEANAKEDLQLFPCLKIVAVPELPEGHLEEQRELIQFLGVEFMKQKVQFLASEAELNV